MYRVLPKAQDEEAFKKYKEAKLEAKKVVSKARSMYLDEVYSKLRTNEGENDIYKLTRIRKRKCQDLNQIRCVKG